MHQLLVKTRQPLCRAKSNFLATHIRLATTFFFFPAPNSLAGAGLRSELPQDHSISITSFDLSLDSFPAH